jgi:O-methyltransferase involved in polyketide biosynthesis
MEQREASDTAALTAMLRAVHQVIDDEPRIVDDPIAVGLATAIEVSFSGTGVTELGGAAIPSAAAGATDAFRLCAERKKSADAQEQICTCLLSSLDCPPSVSSN